MKQLVAQWDRYLQEPARKYTLEEYQAVMALESWLTLREIRDTLSQMSKHIERIDEGRLDRIELFLHERTDGAYPVTQAFRPDLMDAKEAIKTAESYREAVKREINGP